MIVEIENFKRKQLIDEFCNKCDLEAYRDLVANLLDLIKQSDCDICCSSISCVSSYSGGIIRIGVKTKRKSNLHFLWEILHEYGHFLSGPPA